MHEATIVKSLGGGFAAGFKVKEKVEKVKKMISTNALILHATLRRQV